MSDGSSTSRKFGSSVASIVIHSGGDGTKFIRGVKVNGSIAERSLGHKTGIRSWKPLKGHGCDDVISRLSATVSAPRYDIQGYTPGIPVPRSEAIWYSSGSTDGDMKHAGVGVEAKPRYVSYKRV